MDRPRRNLLLAALVLILVAVEVGLNLARPPAGCVRISNEGNEPILDMVATCGKARASVARIAPGEMADLVLNRRGKAPLSIRFRQRGNPLTSIDLPEFDPGQMERDHNRLVLTIRIGEVERYQEEADPTTRDRVVGGFMSWLRRSLTPP